MAPTNSSRGWAEGVASAFSSIAAASAGWPERKRESPNCRQTTAGSAPPTMGLAGGGSAGSDRLDKLGQSPRPLEIKAGRGGDRLETGGGILSQQITVGHRRLGRVTGLQFLIHRGANEIHVGRIQRDGPVVFRVNAGIVAGHARTDAGISLAEGPMEPRGAGLAATSFSRSPR